MDNKKIRDRFQYVFAGAERSGKSYAAREIGNKYVLNKVNITLVYNIGRLTDFDDKDGYELFEPLSFIEHIEMLKGDKDAIESYKLNSKIEYFRYKEKVYNFEDFNKLFRGKKVKMFRVAKRVEENAFFNALYLYASNMLFILDDCKPLFAYGLKEHHIQLFSRKNHTGTKSSVVSTQGKGIDILLIFHDIDTVTNDVWLYSTDIFMFKTSMDVTGRTLKSNDLIASVQKIQKYLQVAEQYTCVRLALKGENYNKQYKTKF